MFERIQLKQMNEHVWLMDDAREATGYLVVGSNKAMVIDTMNGVEDVQAVVRTITDLPVIVVNTHGHCDHIFGNIFFPDSEVYLHPADFEIAKAHFGFFEALKEHPEIQVPQFLETKEGDVFDLGGLTVEVFETPGHTPGSIVLLLREDRILFTGDAINRHTWMQLEESLSIKDTLKALERVAFLEERADKILHGHTPVFDDISLMSLHRDAYRQLAEQEGTTVTDADPEYKWFGGVCKQHPFAEYSVIVYREDNL